MKKNSNNTNNNMKQNILICATKLIAKNGIKNTSLADIAKDVNISKGTLYYHYSSKDDIICDIADSHLHIVNKAVLNCVQNMKTENPHDDTVKFIMQKISTIESTGRVHMYLICEAITGNDTLRERIKVKYIDWRQTLKTEILNSLEDSVENSDALSFLLISIIDGLVVQSLLKTEKIPFENISSFLVKNWF
ncbi:TetR/AcrR family transcriptional regulator [Romboutsia sp.]|uniref:TetR/AcrR family transcriptional regulator n=1 Tax=Romboutsia sp. TaxID=1965302 RepID=UPI003F2BC301